MNSPKNICLNCNKPGHMLKLCPDPVISCGIICLNIDNKFNVNYNLLENYFYNKYIDVSEFNYQNLSNIKYIPLFYDKIKILMIRRQHSLNYVEFIRGKYNIDNLNHLYTMFKIMTKDEIIKIKTLSFEILWKDLWNQTAGNKIYQKEFTDSKEKFNKLVKDNFYNLLDKIDDFPYTEPEWGFPKGRKNHNEKHFDCAIREFYEETNLDPGNLHMFERVGYLEELYQGSNSVKYKHIYYIGTTENSHEKINLNENQLAEIGDIKWVTIPEALEKIRPYYTARIKIIHQIYFFIINLIIDININGNFINKSNFTI